MKYRGEDGEFDIARFRAACRTVFIAQEILVDHASYPTKRIAQNSHLFRPIGLGYSNLGCLLDVLGPALRFGRSPRNLRRDHRAAARHGLLHQHRVGRGGRHVRRFREEPRADAPRDGNALGEGRGNPQLPEVSARRRPLDVGRGPLARPALRLPQRADDRARADRHHQLHDGLRHDGHRAGHRLGEVQAIGRRRNAENGQPDGAAGAEDDRLRRRADRGHYRLHRQARHHRRRSRNSRTSICRSSIAPSRRKTASVRFPGGRTSR